MLKQRILLITVFLMSFFSLNAQENCTNGIDDDGDGLIDCLDPDCLNDAAACPAFAVPGGCLPIGYYPDIIGSEVGFKAANQIADVSIPIPVNTERLSLVIQGVYQQGAVVNQTGINDLNYGEERIVWGRVEIDITNQTSSGWVEYMSNNHDSRRFSWVNEPLTPNSTSTYTTVGHDYGELVDFEFTFNQVGPNLIVGCTRPDVDISYYTLNYGNSATQSLTRIDGTTPAQYPAYFPAGTYSQTINMQAAPNNADFVILRGIGINQNRYGSGGVLVSDLREESLAIKYIVCDLTSMTASGIMTVNGGNIPSMNTSFTFTNYDLTSGQPIVANSTLMGDFTGNITPPNQITVSDMTIQVIGNNLTLTRSTVFGDDYNEMYYVEFLKYTNQPYSSSFFITKNDYNSPYDIGYDPGNNNDGISVPGFVDFIIPAGSKRAYVEMRGNGLYKNLNLVGPTNSNSSINNDNQMYSFAEINFDLNESTGYYATLTTTTQQQIYAWQGVPFGIGNINASPVYGQLPNNDERIDYEFVNPNILRVHLTNDNIAYERVIQATFLGSKINLVYSSFTQNNAIYTGCDSVYFDMEICNSGGADLTESIPISFYTGDPTNDPNSVYLQTEDYNLNIDQGQCENFTFGIDITSLGGATSGNITIVLNDNGINSGALGGQIPATWPISSLGNQGNPVLECEFNQNIITAAWNQPMPANPPTITFNQNSALICPGDSATFIATTNLTNGAVNLQWTPGGVPDTTNTITVSPNVSTWYFLNLSDVCFDIIDSVKVDIGTVDLTNITIVDAVNCPGQANPVLGSVSILPDNPLWTYTLGNQGTQNSGNFTNVPGGQTYLLTVVSDDGCIIDTLITVGIDAALAVTVDWNLDSLSDVSCFGMQDGSAYIDNIQGGIAPPFDIDWSNTASGNFATSTANLGGDDDIDNLFGGQWIVTVTDQQGCSWSQAFNIFEPDLLEVDLSNSSEPSCFELNDGDITVIINGGNSMDNGTVSITNSGGTELYAGSLTVNQLVTDTYTINITDENGCQSSETIFLDEPGEIDIDFTIINPVCYGIESGQIIIDTVYNYQGQYDSLYYDWLPNPNGTNGIGQNSTSYLGEDTYQLKITDSTFCFKFFEFEIVYPDSIYFSELDFLPAVCRNNIPFDNGHGQVYVAAEGGSDGNGNGTNFSYLWTEESTGLTTTNSTWGNKNPGYYTVVATNDLGCEITETIYLDSLSPEAIFTLTSPDFTSEYEGTAVVDITITNESINYAVTDNPLYTSSNNGDTTFIWTFGFAGESPYITGDINEILTQQYLEEGVYEICLIVIENSNFCVDTACQEIIIHDFPSLIIPNVFTPGTDGINDEFFFPNVAIVDFTCSVFDRWGKQVFQFNSITDGWNGKNMNNDKDCTDGVYFYMYEATSTDGTEFIGQGNIHLIRN